MWPTILAIGSSGLALSLYVFQRRLIYAANYPEDARKVVWKPSQFGLLNFEEVFLTSADGVRIHAYWIPCPNATHTIIYFHVPSIKNTSIHRCVCLGKCGQHGTSLADYSETLR